MVNILSSTTFEEAVAAPGTWIRQRSRWLKGWMQTWLVHMRNPIRTFREMGMAGFTVFQVLMGGIVISALVHPFFLVAIGYGLVSRYNLAHIRKYVIDHRFFGSTHRIAHGIRGSYGDDQTSCKVAGYQGL